MSHVVKIKTQVRDTAAVRAGCSRLKLPSPVEGEFKLFNETARGLAVQLRGWRYPVVFDLTSGESRYDNFAGNWGEQDRLDQFLQAYAIETRRIWVSPYTANPTSDWTTQQARNFAMYVEEHELPCELVQRDNDATYMASFDEVFTSGGARIKKTPPKSPNLQAFVERVVQTRKHEVLNRFCIVNEQQLDHILSHGMDWYNDRRCHSERDNRPPVRDEAEPEVIDLASRKIECSEELGGQLKSYRIVA